MACRANAAGVVDVLQRIGNAVKRPTVDTGLQFRIRPVRVGQRTVPRQQNESVQAGILGGDAAQRILRQLL